MRDNHTFLKEHAVDVKVVEGQINSKISATQGRTLGMEAQLKERTKEFNLVTAFKKGTL